MNLELHIPKTENSKTLKDFIPLMLAFFCGLVVLSFYQNLRLYFSGVLYSFFNKSLILLLINHIGFSAITALIAVFLFNYLESKKSNLGFRVVRLLLSILLIVEGLLIAYYVQNYEILGVDIYGLYQSDTIKFSLLEISLVLLLTLIVFYYSNKLLASIYKLISKMYPFTIVLFSMFLAILNSNKKPVNENKTQHLIAKLAANLFDTNKYQGTLEFPLIQEYQERDVLSSYIKLGKVKPNLVFLLIDGLGADFVGENARFKHFMPNLTALSKEGLVWKNFVSNSGASFATLPTVMGSLPFGLNGFTNIKNYTNRNTLYSILKQNGYTTSFNYGGNSALNHYDRFLNEENVDLIIDKKTFGKNYKLQKADAAGVTLGYPDKELFKRYESQPVALNESKLDVFLTLSTKSSFIIPKKEFYENKVLKIVTQNKHIGSMQQRLIENHIEIFASFLYADTAILDFINRYKSRGDYKNTIFIITGTHRLHDLPQQNELGRYRVPFIIYSPLLNTPGTINSLASHADIAPTIVSFLDANYKLKVPNKIAWIGNSLIESDIFSNSKKIPLFRDRNNIQDYIQGNLFFSGDRVFELDENLNLSDFEDEAKVRQITNSFQYFKSVNKYVTERNKIIPKSVSLLQPKTEFSKSEIIWIESVFNGKDADNAYNTARKLAFDNDWDRSLLLCKYILSQTPRHADTEILMGRLYAWQKKYSSSEKVLKEVIRKYPKYTDGYLALLDSYYWAGTHQKALTLLNTIKINEVNTKEVNEKIERALKYSNQENADSLNK